MEGHTTTNSPTRDLPLEREGEGEKDQPTSMPSSLQDSEKKTNKNTEQESTEEEYDYITGFKFVILMMSITLAVFLMLLDISIIVTVRSQFTIIYRCVTADNVCLPPGHPRNHERLPLSP